MTHLARAYAMALDGLKGIPVEVQTHIGPGIVGTTLVGLPDASLRESKERVRAALFSLGVPTLNRRVTVNLSPADLPKAGASFDLAIAVSMLTVRDLLSADVTGRTVFMAELGLDGALLPVPGVLPAALAAKQLGFERIVVSHANRNEAELVDELRVSSCSHLKELVLALDSESSWEKLEELTSVGSTEEEECFVNNRIGDSTGGSFSQEKMDLCDLQGQNDAIQALVVAAVGGHHLLLHGPAGVGKTMLAARLPGILPPLNSVDALTVTALRSLARRSTTNGRVTTLVNEPPIEAPHHSATMISLVGGGGNPIRPGAISLAHCGVLVLDEAPEFPRRTLDALRQPLESSVISIHRAHAQIVFPARFQLVLTANPCPCGGGDGSASKPCTCSPLRVRQYRNRLSGPLLDRVDLQVNVPVPTKAKLVENVQLTSDTAREQILEARNRSAFRLKDTPWTLNAQVPGQFIRQEGILSRNYLKDLETDIARGIISLRGADRILRILWSSADLNGRSEPSEQDLSIAKEFRGITRAENSWI